jgi:hypothetical protein
MASTLKSGSSTKSPELLRMSQTRDHLISKMLEDQTISKLGTPTQDGSNSSTTDQTTSLMLRTTRFLMLKVVKMLKDKLFGFGRDITMQTKDGMLFM